MYLFVSKNQHRRVIHFLLLQPALDFFLPFIKPITVGTVYYKYQALIVAIVMSIQRSDLDKCGVIKDYNYIEESKYLFTAPTVPSEIKK